MTLTVYILEVGEDQEWIFPADNNFERFFAMDGTTIASWDSPVMRIDREEKAYSDCPWLGEHSIFLKQPAIEALSPLLLKYGQILPVRGEDVRFFNATTVLDALDYERSRVVRFDDGSILTIEKHVFDAARIGAAALFKLPMRASMIYVTDEFVEQVRHAGLRGVSFKLVWSNAAA